MRNDTSQIDLHDRLRRLSGEVTTLVDAGCGRGAHLRGSDGAAVMQELRQRRSEIIGIDVSIPPEGNPYVTDLREITAGNRWPVASDSVDLVFCDWVLEHVAEPNDFFRECARVLRPSGRLVARTLQRWSVAGIGARLVPARLHRPMIAFLQPSMSLDDVFPTTLRCNTSDSLGRLCADHDMALTDVRRHRGLSGYGTGRRRVQAGLDAVEGLLPEAMWHTIVVTATKHG